MFRRSVFAHVFAFLVLLALASACAPVTAPSNASTPSQSSPAVKVVAAENFYGDIAKQLGASHVQVTSILSDPNVDPHEYESSVQNGIAVSQANVVVENGLGYDSWMDKLLSASPNPNRVVVIAGKVAPHPLPDNPHVWYGIDNISAIAQAMSSALTKVDPKDQADFAQNLATFDNSLEPIKAKLAEMNQKYGKTPVGLTETIYLYQTQPMGLTVLTPFAFEMAVAEGNDPPANTVATVNDQIDKKQIKVLIYNSQTVTPITTHLQDAAKQQNIPVVSVSETMPVGKTYQSWMLDQLTALEQNLQTVQ
jgi:zinc/manganese transport system substrate-binding protein